MSNPALPGDVVNVADSAFYGGWDTMGWVVAAAPVYPPPSKMGWPVSEGEVAALVATAVSTTPSANDASVAALVGNPASSTRGSLGAAFLDKVSAASTYAPILGLSTVGVDPDGVPFFAAAGAGTAVPQAATQAGLAVNVLDKGAKGDGVTNDTAAFLAALATGRPVYVPGSRGTVYLVDELSAGFISNTVMFGAATLKLNTTSSGYGFLYLSGVSNFLLDGLTFDANYQAMHAMRFVDCTGFDLGTTTYTHGTFAGIDLQECLDFRATTLTADNNGAAGGQVGAGVYLREKTGGTGCKRFDIGSVRGKGNGLGVGLDGATFQTSGSAVTGTVGRVTGRNNTRYGAKIMQTGGFVQIGQIIATGNENGVSFSGCTGTQVASIYADANTAIGVWFDAGCSNIHVGSIVATNSGGPGCQILGGASDIVVHDLLVNVTDTLHMGGTNGRGLDSRGVTRGAVANLTVINAGSGAVNTSDAINVSGVTTLQLGNVTVVDTRATTARVMNALNLNSVTGGAVTTLGLTATNCQNPPLYAANGLSVLQLPPVTPANPGVAAGSDAVVVNNIITALRALGLLT